MTLLDIFIYTWILVWLATKYGEKVIQGFEISITIIIEK